MSDKQNRIGEDVFDGDSYIRRTVRKKREPSPSEEKHPRHTYRLVPGLHEEIKEIAAEEGIYLNELVRYVLISFVAAWKDGDIDLPVREKTIKEKELVY